MASAIAPPAVAPGAGSEFEYYYEEVPHAGVWEVGYDTVPVNPGAHKFRDLSLPAGKPAWVPPTQGASAMAAIAPDPSPAAVPYHRHRFRDAEAGGVDATAFQLAGPGLAPLPPDTSLPAVPYAAHLFRESDAGRSASPAGKAWLPSTRDSIEPLPLDSVPFGNSALRNPREVDAKAKYAGGRRGGLAFAI